MSSKHKHEWGWGFRAKPTIVCLVKDCDIALQADDMIKRANATEEISAKDARRILRLHAANENDDMWILNAYAERMEDA